MTAKKLRVLSIVYETTNSIWSCSIWPTSIHIEEEKDIGEKGIKIGPHYFGLEEAAAIKQGYSGSFVSVMVVGTFDELVDQLQEAGYPCIIERLIKELV